MKRVLSIVVLLMSIAAPASAAVRIAGPTRYETAAEVARAAGESTGAVLVRGDAFPDALAAAGLGGPILLTERDALPASTAAALDDLAIEHVTVLGGTGAVSTAVEAQVTAMGISVDRIAGADRYTTAAAASFDADIAVLASGETFADALAIGPYAHRESIPVLLTQRDALPAATAEALAHRNRVIVVGGTAAVSAAVEQQVRDLGVVVERVAGPSRQETAIAVAGLFDAPARVVLARGDKFPDALAAASLELPILLDGDATTAWLDDHPVAVTVLGDAPTYQWRPRIGDTWHLQLTGDLVTDVDVDVYDIDLFDTPQATIDDLHRDGRRVVCYVSAGSWEEWRDDAGDWPEAVLGEPLDGWEGERWVDVRALDVVGPRLEARFDVAAAKGCDALDPDNVDGWAHDTGFPLTEADSLAFNRFLVREAHERGLAVGLKNALELVPELADEVDFAVNEQCLEFEECDTLAPYDVAGHPVFGVEYQGTFAEVCTATDDVGAWLLADLALDGEAQPCKTG